MKKNVTITLDPEVALWARVEAARQDRSVSSFVSGLLEERMGDERVYRSAMRAFLARPPQALRAPGDPLPHRSALHSRGPRQ